MTGGLTVRGLWFSYPTSPILEDLNIEIEAGGVCALIGESGAGKTTLIKCLLQLEKPSRGIICYLGTTFVQDGTATKPSIKDAGLDRLLGYVPQSGLLFPHLTALENLTLVLREVHKLEPKLATKTARTALSSVGIEEIANLHPWQMSGGQQQRAAIARALAIRPQIFLLDEPTGALDVNNSDIVGQAIKDDVRTRGACALVATHNLGFARKHCDSIALLAKRCIQWHARTDEIELDSTLMELG
jgi:ABC-type polar amino acid transport system ATPase subunit